MNLKPSPRKVNDRVLSPELRAKIDGKLDKISAEAIYRKKPIPTDPETLIKMDELSAAVRSAIQSGGGGEPGSGGGSYDDTELRTRISNVETEIAAHKADEVKHITSAERASWNNKAEVNQVTKMNIIAPHTTTIDIPYTARFDRLPVEVLKMTGGEKDVIKVLAEFDNADKEDFIRNSYIEFDGTMHLKTDYRFVTEKTEDDSDIYSFEFNELDIFDDGMFDIECGEVA